MYNTTPTNDPYLLIRPYLQQREKILWIGQPRASQLFSGEDLFLIPFSFLWGGFAIFWESMALAGGPSFFALWGVPFVVIGQYMIWGRFVHKYLSRKHTLYAVTERRVIILQNLFGSSFNSYYFDKIPQLSLRGNSIRFGLGTPYKSRSRKSWSADPEPGFYALNDPEDVYRVLNQCLSGGQPY